MALLFVTATGTGVGKTMVTGALARHAARAGRSVLALKPVASGFSWHDMRDSDPGHLLAAQGLAVTRDAVEAICPWRFAAPLSPDMAAAREGRTIDFDALTGFCRARSTAAEVVLVEGVGGVMVPLDGRHTVLDWIDRLACPALLVAGSYLGTLSHCLTAAAALAGRGVPLAGLVVSESQDATVPLADTAESLRRHLPGVVVMTVPRLSDHEILDGNAALAQFVVDKSLSGVASQGRHEI